MRVHPVHHRIIINGIFLIFVLFTLLAVCGYAAIAEDSPEFALGLVIFVAVGFVVAATRLVLLPRKNWVDVGADAISWRTPAKVPYPASPSGSVPLSAVATWAETPTEYTMRGKPLRGSVLTLTLRDGSVVSLPLWTPATMTNVPMTQLQGLLRNALGEPTA